MSYLIEKFLDRCNAIDEDLIVEGIADVKRKYPNIDDDTFMNIIKLDPTYKDGVDSVGTYGKWLLTIYNRTKKIPDTNVINLLKEFDANKRYLDASDRDIGKYKTIDELEQKVNSIEPHEVSKTRKNKDIRKAIRKTNLVDDAEYLGTFDDFEVYIPKTYEASCKLGQGTTWCTASNSDNSYYNSYSEEGPLYIMINTKNPSEKYQLHVESEQFKNKDDHELSKTELANIYVNNPKLWEFIKKVSSKNSYLTDKYDNIEKNGDKYKKLNDTLKENLNVTIQLPSKKYTRYTDRLIGYYFGSDANDNILYLLCSNYVSSSDEYLEMLDSMILDWSLQDVNEVYNDSYVYETIFEDELLKNNIEEKYNVTLNNIEDAEELVSFNEELNQAINDCILSEIEHSYDKQYNDAFVDFLSYKLPRIFPFFKNINNHSIQVNGNLNNILKSLYDTNYGGNYEDEETDISNILEEFNWENAEDIITAITPIFILDVTYYANNFFDSYANNIYPEYDLLTLGDYL